MGFHFYADDTQLYISFKSGSSCKSAILSLENCVEDIKKWMLENMLKLNDDKTEFLLIGSPYFYSKNPSASVKIGKIEIQSVTHTKNLGTIFDCFLKMDKFVNFKCSSIMYYIRSIAKIRKCLTTDATKALVHAFVTSRLDYANSLLYGINKSLVNKLQVLQNAAARVVTQSERQTHASPILKSLHWLPVEKRIKFKALTIVYNSINGTAPAYLSELLPSFTNNKKYRLRSNNFKNLPSTTTLNSYGDRCFPNMASSLWNQLPASIKNAEDKYHFQKILKTHLFFN